MDDKTRPSQIEKGSYVICYCKNFERNMKGQVLDLKMGHSEKCAYVTFVGQDKRLDKWVAVSELRPYNKSKSSHPSKSTSGNDDDDNSPFEVTHRELTKIRNIDSITLGDQKMLTWYYSPYPYPFHDMPHLFICEHCLRYFQTKEELDMHLRKTMEIEPYGREIYRDGNLSIYEMKGNCQKIPCQCLCLLGKLFLDHKTLYYDVECFSFYLLCECDENGCHLVGYSSREVNSEDHNILACIVVFPPYQHKGYGTLLISLSYEIARRKHLPGGPETPLSDLGYIAFNSFWKEKLLEVLKNHSNVITSIENLVELTGIAEDDIKNVLEDLGVVQILGKTRISINQATLLREVKNLSKKTKRKFNEKLLIWMPDDDDYDL